MFIYFVFFKEYARILIGLIEKCSVKQTRRDKKHYDANDGVFILDNKCYD